MAFTLGATVAKDGAGNTIAGGLLSADIAGGGVGPTFIFNGIVDGLAGSNRLNITAANAMKVDGSAVTQPVSLTSTTITGTVAVTQSGTWTVQPGNTANTTAWKVDGSAVTQPVSGSLTTVSTVTSLTQMNGVAIALNTGVRSAGTQRVTIATDDLVPVNNTQINGVAISTGSGALGTGTQRVALATDSPGVIATAAPGTLSAAGPSVTAVNPSNYETVAASQTAQVLGATGATGDFVNGLLVVPATTSPGNVLLLDNATSITVFTGGATSVSNLVPFFIPLGMTSVSGAWKVTTGANVSCIGVGKFT